MPNESIKTNKLSIYMIKPEYQKFEDIIESEENPHYIDGVGHFFFDESHPHKPSWVETFFGSNLDKEINIYTSSAKGILIVPIRHDSETINFAVSFGVGRHLLKDGVIEERFGLKVVLNSVDLKSFRSIDKTTLGSVPKQSREQMSRDVAPAEFGIDVEQDLISSVTGRSRDGILGITVSGRDAFSVSVKVDTTNVVNFLAHCFERYRSTDYKKDFDWIDQITEVRNKHLEKELNDDLFQKLNHDDFEKIWMAVPEVVEWSGIAGFRYIKAKKAALHEDLDISEFISELKGNQLTEDLVKNSSVFMISAINDDVSSRWPVFRCIYAEKGLGGKLYILNNGKWYEIAQSFTDEVQRDYANMPHSAIPLPDCVFNDEAVYNVAATQSIPSSCCMDGKLIMHGGGHSRIEFCDLYTTDKKLVHIKRYGGSSVLSHLFSQGVVSGELFVSDIEFRRKLNEALPITHKLSDLNKRLIASDYEIVYGIISNSSSPLDIPFFSKVSLKNARRRLSSYGYQVSLKKINKIETSLK